MADLKSILGESYHEGMSAEEISTALQSVSVYSQTDYDRLKNSVSRANSESADRKRQLEEQQNNAVKADEEWQRKYADLDKRFKAMERERTISAHTARFVEQGYSAELAKTAASALADGNADELFKSMTSFLTERDKKMSADRMRNQPRAEASGGTGNPVNYESEIQQAMAAGDQARAAALIRMQYESANPK